MWVQSLGWKDSPWSRKCQTTPERLPEKFHGQRNPAGYIVHGVAKSQTQLSVYKCTAKMPQNK